MKTKNIALAVVTTLFVAGSVFATLTPESGYVKIRYVDETEPHCRALGICDDSGDFACRIRVNGVDYQAFKAGCTVPIRYTGSAVVATLNDPNIAEVYNTAL